MREVYLHATSQLELGPSQEPHPLLASLPLARRMTPLQRVLVLAVLQLAVDAGPLMTHLSEVEAPFYFSSTYGEIGAMIRVLESLLKKELPVSPKDFQHSVLNAALAYVSMQLGSHQPAFAMPCGYASPDKTLQLAARRIASGLDAAALVLHAHEYSALAGGHARAEVLLLAAEPLTGKGWRLSHCAQARRGPAAVPERAPELNCFHEAEQAPHIPWLLVAGAPYARRLVTTVRGEELRTDWAEVAHAGA